MAPHDEVPLLGGMSTPGVVRVGDTVRRPMGANSEYVHGLLLTSSTAVSTELLDSSESIGKAARS